MTGNILKIIACITMLIDHTAAVLYFNKLIDFNLYIMLRSIGRIAFPIFGFLMVEGYKHTKDVSIYRLRLFVAAFISQVPYTYFCYKLFGKLEFNVLWLFLLATIIFDIWNKKDLKFQKIIMFFVVALAFILSEVLRIDYGMLGLLYLLILYNNQYKVLGSIILTSISCIKTHTWYQMPCLLAIIPLCLYNGKRGSKSKIIQYGFYLFYPVHLALLCLML